jgi:(p)ppGpp synthase/HD superfamily hydrolase
MNSTITNPSLPVKARKFAEQAHGAINHRYGDKPYTYHLEMVYGFTVKYSHLLTPEEVVLAQAGAWVHDVIEDAHKSYNDVKKELGKEVAEIAFALTNEKGRTRKERANGKYYKGIRENRVATFVKICDRLANVKHSCETSSEMKKCYKKEFQLFQSKLRTNEDFDPMWSELEILLD